MIADHQHEQGELNAGPAGLRALFEHIDELVFCCDSTGGILFVSDSVRTVLGHAPEYLLGRNVLDILHPDDVDAAINALTRWAGRSGSPRGSAVSLRAVDGTYVEMQYDAAIGNDFGNIGTLVITLHAASNVDRVERELRAQSLNQDRIVRLSSAFLNLPTEDFDKGIELAVTELASLEDVTRASVWRMAGPHLVLQAAWEAPLDAPSVPLAERFRADDFTSVERARQGRDTLFRQPWPHDAEFEPERQLFEAAGTTNCLISPMIARDLFVGIVMLETTLPDEFGAIHASAMHSACAVLAEAFLRNDAERRLAVQALTDRVTGLANRWAFDAELERALSDVVSGERPGVALCIVDLDRFKNINDTYGHAVGDQLLAEVAQRLQGAAHNGVLVGRLGGDELLLLIEDLHGPDAALARAEDILAALEAPFALPGGARRVSASAGVAFSSDGRIEATDLMNQADVALFRAKANGGDNALLAEPDAHRERSVRLRREDDLRKALETGELIVHYQPEYELATGRLLGAEALVRWEHPSEGLLAAGEFVPIAEASGLMVELGSMVLRSACAEAASWLRLDSNSDLLVRVNVAARQLRDTNFTSTVEEALSAAALPPSALCLELTESTLLDDPQGAALRFNELRELGVGLAIDDFGTGYSSYLQLRSLPLSALKIDRAFVTDLPRSVTDRAIVSSTLDLAAALGLTVTAEGVETDAQRQALIDLGCHAAQGFLLGRPMPAVSYRALLDG